MDNEALRQVFKTLHPKITRDVNPGSVIDALFSKHIISDDDYHDLLEVPGGKNRCRRLFSLLHLSSHPETFTELRLALRVDYPWIVEEIDEQLTSLTAQQQQQQQSHHERLADGKFLLSTHCKILPFKLVFMPQTG